MTSQSEHMEYAPESCISGGVIHALPRAEQIQPAPGATFFTPNILGIGELYTEHEWAGDFYNNLWFSRGLVYRNANDAVEAAKAILAMTTAGYLVTEP